MSMTDRHVHDKQTALIAYIIALHIEVGEVEGDAVLVGGYNLPHTVLVGGIQVREGGTLDGSGSLINVPSTGI